jgi:hypothetical protein
MLWVLRGKPVRCGLPGRSSARDTGGSREFGAQVRQAATERDACRCHHLAAHWQPVTVAAQEVTSCPAIGARREDAQRFISKCADQATDYGIQRHMEPGSTLCRYLARPFK